MRLYFVWLFTLASVFITPGSAAAEGGPVLLDTIGAFETEVGAQVQPLVKPAWIPTYKFVVEFDGFDQNDVVLVQWKLGGKAMGKPVPCAPAAGIRDAQVNPQTPVVPAHLLLFDCKHPKDSAVSRGGAFTLELVYKQTLVDKKTPLATLEATAIELKQGSQNKQTSTWMASHDHRLTGAIIEEHINYGRDYNVMLQQVALQHHDAARAAKLGGSTHYNIRFWTKYKQGGPTRMTMSCLLDGKPVVEGKHAGGQTRSYWTYKGKDKESGDWAEQVFQFVKSRVYKQDDEAGVWMWNEHPGDYRCVATAGGEIIKEVFFTIDAEGKVVDSPCQKQMRTLRHIRLVRAKDTSRLTNTTFDAKAGKKGYFGRVTWGAGCPSDK